MKIVKWFFITPVILIVLGVIGTELNKAYWDNQVRAMCEKDGGVTVFEKVYLSKTEFKKLGGNKYGQIPVRIMQIKNDNYPYYSEALTINLRKENPKIYKYEGRIFRETDHKLLGLMINYGRSGGDFPTGFHPSNFGCKNLKNIRLDVEKQVFVIKGEK